MVRKDLLALMLPAVLAACSSTGDAAPVLAAAAATNDQPLRDSTARLATAWNAGDGDALGAEYWPDGSLINILGVVFPNAVAIAAVTKQILAGPFKGSNFAGTIRRVRFLGTAAAIVETDVSITQFHALPPGAVATSPGLLLTRLTHVFENRNGIWRIAASQNTSVLPGAVSGQPS